MSGPHAAMADAVMSAIRGQQDAQKLLHVCRQGCAPSNALHADLQVLLSIGDEQRTLAWCRTIQKAVECTA